MLNINTNLSSLIVQRNLLNSTLGLNSAIEKMTTGYKINHAKDNAANFSIANKIGVDLSSYDIARENTAMGLDMLATASDGIELITSHLQRIRDLAEQAANGTYGKDSLKAIQSEVDARTDEIKRIKSNTEYNGLSLYGNGGVSGNFISKIQQLSEEEAVKEGYTVIHTAEELQNIDKNMNGKYILMNDIDLSGVDWDPIGDFDNTFKGELNGNGYVIKNLKIVNKSNRSFGLFGSIDTTAKIENLGVENVHIDTNDICVGAISGISKGTIQNCYSTGYIDGGQQGTVGGLVGKSSGTIESCYSTVNVEAWANYNDYIVGGLVGNNGGLIKNSYATGTIIISSPNSIYGYAGGLAGILGGKGSIENSYATANIIDPDMTFDMGGLVGMSEAGTSISNCYALGVVEGNIMVGGLVGENQATVTNSYFNNINNVATSDGNINGATGLSLQDLAVKMDEARNNGSLATIAIQDNPCNFEFQIGINSDASSIISVDTGLQLGYLDFDVSSVEQAKNTITTVDNFLKILNENQTNIGSGVNRLESVLESISINIENLTSSRSTIKDADIAAVSSDYIRNQILQQASATLLATANQTPSIALNLI